jgi:hypothetical protein
VGASASRVYLHVVAVAACSARHGDTANRFTRLHMAANRFTRLHMWTYVMDMVIFELPVLVMVIF